MSQDLGGSALRLLANTSDDDPLMQHINRAVVDVLTAKFAAGLFDAPFTPPLNASTVYDTDRALAKSLADESLVLVVNRNQRLPLTEDFLKAKASLSLRFSIRMASTCLGVASTCTTVENYDDSIAVKPCSPSACKLAGACTQDVLIERVRLVGFGASIGSVPPHAVVNCVRNVTWRNVSMPCMVKGIYITSNPSCDPYSGHHALIENILYQDVDIFHPRWWAISIGPRQMHEPHEPLGSECPLDYPITKLCPTQWCAAFRNVTLRHVRITGSWLSPGVILGNATRPMGPIAFVNVVATSSGTLLFGDRFHCEDALVSSIGDGFSQELQPSFSLFDIPLPPFIASSSSSSSSTPPSPFPVADTSRVSVMGLSDGAHTACLFGARYSSRVASSLYGISFLPNASRKPSPPKARLLAHHYCKLFLSNASRQHCKLSLPKTQPLAPQCCKLFLPKARPPVQQAGQPRLWSLSFFEGSKEREKEEDRHVPRQIERLAYRLTDRALEWGFFPRLTDRAIQIEGPRRGTDALTLLYTGCAHNAHFSLRQLPTFRCRFAFTRIHILSLFFFPARSLLPLPSLPSACSLHTYSGTRSYTDTHSRAKVAGLQGRGWGCSGRWGGRFRRGSWWVEGGTDHGWAFRPSVFVFLERLHFVARGVVRGWCLEEGGGCLGDEGAGVSSCRERG